MIAPDAIERYCHQHTAAESKALQEVSAKTVADESDHMMLTGRIESRFLQLLVHLTPARRILEIGTYTGYSALAMAEAMPEDGKLTTLEYDPEHVGIARAHLDKSPHGKKVTIVSGPALESLRDIHDTFDLVFVDADKENYPAYYEATFPLLRTGGLMVVDNALWSGGVLDPQTDAAIGVDRINRRMSQDERIENVLLTIRDGVHVGRKVRG